MQFWRLSRSSIRQEYSHIAVVLLGDYHEKIPGCGHPKIRVILRGDMSGRDK